MKRIHFAYSVFFRIRCIQIHISFNKSSFYSRTIWKKKLKKIRTNSPMPFKDILGMSKNNLPYLKARDVHKFGNGHYFQHRQY